MHLRLCGLSLAILMLTTARTNGHEPVTDDPSLADVAAREPSPKDHWHEVCAAPMTPREKRARDAHHLIVRVAEIYRVPPGAVYGIWQKETHGLFRDWGRSEYWYRAVRLTYKKSVCVEQYGAERCWDQWLALRRLCAQARHVANMSTMPLCDPLRVRASYAMALGPMQHMPGSLLERDDDGRYRWARHAVDFDLDGVIDPFGLPDAMASAAKFIRRHYDRKVRWLGRKRAWIYAINRYYGSQTAGYYEGDGRRPGVRHYWHQWCEKEGGCVDDADRSVITMAMTPP